MPRPIIIAHRGASGERPEHTIAAYALAIEQGADFIEPDLVLTRDGVFVARHENEISGTTDVAHRPEFADRHATRTIDGVRVSGWFTEDFTLAELRTLRARERLPELRPVNAEYDGRFAIPTLAEVIALAREHGVGIIPEIKHPSYFRSIDLPMEERLAAELAAAGWDDAGDPVMIQCFEVGPLERLDRLAGLRLVQLVSRLGGPADRPGVSYADMITDRGLATIARYADAIGPEKTLVIPRDADNRLGAATTLVADAHARELLVIPWTFRRENQFLPREFQREADQRASGDGAGEIAAYLDAGIDGLFTDFPEDGVRARAFPKP